MATPDMIWLPRLVIEAKPCKALKATDVPIAARSPSHGEPVR